MIMFATGASSATFSPITSSTVSEPAQIDPIKKRLDTLIQGKYVLVFSGFSGSAGYADPELFTNKLKSILQNAVKEHGYNNLLVVAGATSSGIGEVYKIAEEMEIRTLGIVSEQAKKHPKDISPSCNDVVYIPDPENNWKVLYEEKEEKKSYMVYVCKDKGEFYALGGGDVAVSELIEAESSEIKTTVLKFDRHPTDTESILKENPEADPHPVNTYYDNEIKERPMSDLSIKYA